MEIIEVDIEDKKRELKAPVANWCRQRSFKPWGWIRFPAGAQLRNITIFTS